MNEGKTKVGLLFPGQGSQYVGMGKDSLSDENFSYYVKKADEVLGFKLSEIMINGPENILTLTENAQPSIFCVSYALFQVLMSKMKDEGKASEIQFVGAGHSLGEYTAVCASGAISFEDGIKLVHARGKFMQEAVPEGKGAMIAVMGKQEDIEKFLEGKDGVWVANINSETQVVISGLKESVDRLSENLKKNGFRVIPLKVSAPFHCPLMKPAQEKLAFFMENIKVESLIFPVLSAHTLEYYTEDSVKNTLLYGITAKVNFLGCIKKLYSDGVRKFVEIGPGKVLSSLTKRIVPDAEIFTLNSVSDVPQAVDFLCG